MTSNAINSGGVEKKVSSKSTYMLHDPKTMKQLGRFVSTTPRSAAQKAASRGFTEIHLRKTGQKKVNVFEGKVVELDTPKVVQRGESTVTFKKKSVVKSLRTYIMNADVDDDANVPENPKVE
jgi:LysM repeat protein